MRNLRSSILTALLLIGIALGATRWADALQQSIVAYTSPLVGAALRPGEALTPATRRVAVVIISGLGYQAELELAMPNYDALRAAGASAQMLSRPPVSRAAIWTALLTGVWPDLNNAPLLPAGEAAANPRSPAISLDHVLAAARAAGMRTALAGSAEWEALLPAGRLDASYFSPGEDALADGLVAQAALGYIADPQYRLILVHFSQLDAAGRVGGTAGTAYANAARQVDSYLRQITRQLDLSESVLMVTSDVALLADGQRAGGDAVPPALPFIMAGQNVISGSFDPVEQVDLAPTLAVLLGTRLPGTSQGSPLFDMLHFDPAARVVNQLQLAAQQVAVTNTYLAAIGQTEAQQLSYSDLAMAHQSFVDGNQAGALQLAKLATEEARAELAAAQAARRTTEQLPRLALSGLALLVPMALFWVRRLARAPLAGVAASAAVVGFYALYLLSGHPFSFSALDALGGLGGWLAAYALLAVAAGGCLVLAGLLYGTPRRWWAAVSAGYDYGLLTAYLSAVPILFAYWQHGSRLSWYLPNLTWVFWQRMALGQLAAAAVAALAWPWLLGLVTWGVDRRRARARPRSRGWDPIAHLRR